MDETQSYPETPSSRLVAHILSMMLPLLNSKEKTVRYRSTQVISHLINSLDSIDDEYYHLVKVGLLKRIRDKEPMVRVQAVLGLGRLAGNEDDGNQDNADSDDEDASGLLLKLLEVLHNDPSADVRRSLLLNLPLTPGTLPFLLERARDLDSATRRALYSRLLPALGDFRHLSLSMREKLLRWGLRDRDENVRKATARLFRERWIEDCAGPRMASEDDSSKETARSNIDGLLELLERIDVVNSAVENGIASEAMREFWRGRPDYQEDVRFSDPFWDHLTPESVFMARSFNDFCRQEGEEKYESLVGEKMPEVTKLAFFLQRYMNSLVDALNRNSERMDNQEEEDTVEQEFIVEQLLHMARLWITRTKWVAERHLRCYERHWRSQCSQKRLLVWSSMFSVMFVAPKPPASASFVASSSKPLLKCTTILSRTNRWLRTKMKASILPARRSVTRLPQRRNLRNLCCQKVAKQTRPKRSKRS